MLQPENLAVRSNGGILLDILLPSPQLLYVDPFAPEPSPILLATFPVGSASPSAIATSSTSAPGPYGYAPSAAQPTPFPSASVEYLSNQSAQSTNSSQSSYGVSGIVELYPDVFYVATTQFNASKISANVNGTGQMWKLDLNNWNGGPPEPNIPLETGSPIFNPSHDCGYPTNWNS